MNYDPLQPLSTFPSSGPQHFQINTPEETLYGSTISFGNSRITTVWGAEAQVQINQHQIGQFQIINIF